MFLASNVFFNYFLYIYRWALLQQNSDCGTVSQQNYNLTSHSDNSVGR